MATHGDPYLLVIKMSFDSRDILDRYLEAVRKVVDRHDILRTAIIWENLSSPAQIVLRHAPMMVTEISLDLADGPILDQMTKLFDPRSYRIDLKQAPLIRFVIAQDTGGRWIAVKLMHHLISDHSTANVMMTEIKAHLDDHIDTIIPPQPFRNLIAQTRLGPSLETHEKFFSKMLGGIDTPSLPYGFSDPAHDGVDITESHRTISKELSIKIRSHARRMGVSLASLCHLAWAQVISKTSGQERVVFGTVLFGRMQGGAGADQAMGLFINTLPLRVDVDGSNVVEGVHRTQAALATLLEHEHAPLAVAQRCSGIPAGTQVFNSILNCRRHTTQSHDISDIVGVQLLDGQLRANYPFVMSVDDFGTDMSLTAQIVDHIDASQICGYMEQALQSLADALDQSHDTPIRMIEVIPTDESERLLRSWNSTDMAYPHHLFIHQLFEKQVEQTPDAIAIVFEDQSLTYSELNARSNNLAHHLISLGVKPDSLVAICVARSPAMLVALLAVLKAGGAYVPLDPLFASERLHHILADASPSILLADNSGVTALSSFSLSKAMRVVDPNVLREESHDNPQVQGLMSHHLAYVIYTSGSTGKPKGVMTEHQGVTNIAMSRPSIFGVDSTSKVLQFFSYSFDGSLHDISSALCYGGSLHILSDRIRLDRTRLWSYLEEHSITHALFPPALLHDCKDLSPLSTPLTITFGGDALPANLLKTLRLIVPNGSIINDYGPTEATVDAVSWKCHSSFSGGMAPIGRPNINKKVYVLDAHQKPVPVGVVGELYIAGIGIARGYLNRPDLTDKAFFPDPFSCEKESKMYKTGDLVRYLPDGNLMFVGRNDHQVKIRGFRVELGEIETRLSEHPMVREAVVLGFGEGISKRLVAYVVSEDSEGIAHSLREYFMAKLPDYMIPSAFVRLDELPLTKIGKLDRKALPEPDNDAFVRQGYEAPIGEIEISLAAIWSELLKIDRVGRHDNFFMLGGHSLLAVQMIERLRRIGLDLSVRALFETPTLSVLAKTLNKGQTVIKVPENQITSETRVITPEMLPLIDLTQADIDTIVNQVPGGVGNIQDIYALSPLQDGILFHHIMATHGDPYLLVIKMSFDSRDILDRYLEAIQKVVDRHDILRTAIMWENLSVPAQVVLRQAPISVTKVSLNSVDGPILDQMTKLFDPRSHRINLTQAPLIRFAIAQDIDGRWIVIKLMHHSIGDHSTLEVMMEGVQKLVECRGELLVSPQPFRNLIAQTQLELDAKAHEQFFTEMLAGIDTPALPYGLSDVHSDGVDINEFHCMLPLDLSKRLRNCAKKMGVSLASLCHLAWAQVISRTSGQEKVVFGTVLFGRMEGGSGADQAMGLFINTLPIRVDIGSATVEESVHQTHANLAALLDHEHASLGLAQRCSSIPTGTPLFSSLLNYRHNSAPSSQTPGIDGMRFIDSQERTNYPFDISVEDFGDELGLTAQIIKPIDPARVCGYMHRALESLAEALESTPNMPARDLEILPVEERQLLLEDWNSTEQRYSEYQCVHQLFESQASKSPNSHAIKQGDCILTYGDVNSCANSLAHHLIELGVKPDMRVALCMGRSLSMIVVLLAILKAGGAYVPLDPDYPSDRLTYMLTDATPTVLVADEVGLAALKDANLDSIIVVDPNYITISVTTNPEILDLAQHHLAYMIYTSGSTGKPKGVMIEHHGVMNQISTRPAITGVGPTSNILQFSSLSFDGSVDEIFSALCFGGCLHIPPDSIRLDRAQLWKYMEENSITQAELTPAMLQDCKDLKPLSTPLNLILGGDALPPTLLRELQVLIPYGQIVNAYGPTETTVDAVVWQCHKGFSGQVVPIGRPIPNKRIYVLDAQKIPVPLGVVGELYIAGAGIARGYLNRPDLTDKAFLPDPFSADQESRMYRTGDLVRYLPDGNLVFLGRNDHQVKIRGFRIELEEIEARLLDLSIVKEATVLALGDGSGKRLVAYVIAEKSESLAHTLREHLLTTLPEYMVPAAFVRMDSFPLSPSGKLDRGALPEPTSDAFVSQGYQAPLGEIESSLAEIWSELLGIDKVGRHDNFFMLGGHSLLVVQMVEQLR
ncbi:hypothetical protein BGX20_003054, partial [Mortierella sp. AD010]